MEVASRRVLVTGATGVLGPAVVEALASDGWHVRSLSRQAPAERIFPPGVEVIRGDLGDPTALDAALRGVSTVIHMAALLHINRPPAALIPEYQRVNVEGTARLLERAQRARVDRLVFTSSVCVYGGNRGTPLSEHTLPKPDSLYASTKLEAEQLVLGATRADGQPLGTVIRLAAVYGPRLRGNYVRLLKALSRHRFVAIGAGSNHRALVFDRDVGRAIALAAAHPSAAGKVFNLSDGQVHTFAEIVSAMCDALGTPAPRLQIPVACARAAAFGVETVARLLGRPAPIDVRTIDKLVEDVIIDSAQIERELAFQPRVTLRAGWDIVVKALRQQGELN